MCCAGSPHCSSQSSQGPFGYPNPTLHRPLNPASCACSPPPAHSLCWLAQCSLGIFHLECTPHSSPDTPFGSEATNNALHSQGQMGAAWIHFEHSATGQPCLKASLSERNDGQTDAQTGGRRGSSFQESWQAVHLSSLRASPCSPLQPACGWRSHHSTPHWSKGGSQNSCKESLGGKVWEHPPPPPPHVSQQPCLHVVGT